MRFEIYYILFIDKVIVSYGLTDLITWALPCREERQVINRINKSRSTCTCCPSGLLGYSGHPYGWILSHQAGLERWRPMYYPRGCVRVHTSCLAPILWMKRLVLACAWDMSEATPNPPHPPLLIISMGQQGPWALRAGVRVGLGWAGPVEDVAAHCSKMPYTYAALEWPWSVCLSLQAAGSHKASGRPSTRKTAIWVGNGQWGRFTPGFPSTSCNLDQTDLSLRRAGARIISRWCFGPLEANS